MGPAPVGSGRGRRPRNQSWLCSARVRCSFSSGRNPPKGPGPISTEAIGFPAELAEMSQSPEGSWSDFHGIFLNKR